MEISSVLIVDQTVQTILSGLPVLIFMLSKRLSYTWKLGLVIFAVIISNLMDLDHLRVVNNGMKGICLLLGERSELHSLIGIAVVTVVVFLILLAVVLLTIEFAGEPPIDFYQLLLITWATYSSLLMHLMWDARGNYGTQLLYPVPGDVHITNTQWAVTSVGVLIVSLIILTTEYFSNNKALRPS